MKKESFILMGIELRTHNQEGAITIPHHWERFYKEGFASKIPKLANAPLLAVYCDYESDHTGAYSLVIGYPVASGTEPLAGCVIKQVPAGNYEKRTVTGPFPTSLIAAWTDVWNTLNNRAFTYDYELYPEGFDPEKAPTCELYLALRQG